MILPGWIDPPYKALAVVEDRHHQAFVRVLRRAVRRGWPRWGGVMVVRYKTPTGFAYQASLGSSVQSLPEIAYRDVLFSMAFNGAGALVGVVEGRAQAYARSDTPRWEMEKTLDRLSRLEGFFGEIEKANVYISSSPRSYSVMVRYENRIDAALLVSFDRTSMKHSFIAGH